MATAEQATIEATLQANGLSGEALLGLAKKAANDALRRSGSFLDEQRFEELVSFMVEVGLRYVPRYEADHHIALSTFLYRRMRQRHVDWLRQTLGDSRHNSSRRMRVPEGGFVPLNESDGPTWDDHETDNTREAAVQLADELDLTDESKWVLVEVVVRVVDGALPVEAAAAAGLGVQRANRLLHDLRAELAGHGVG